jgi:D-alanyl-D-alanine carboxypeptidase
MRSLARLAAAVFALTLLACGGTVEPIAPSPTATAVTPEQTPGEPPAARTTTTGSPGLAPTSTPTPTQVPLPPVAEEPDLLTPVNERRGQALPSGYEPPDLTAIPQQWMIPGRTGERLRAEALVALLEMFEAAREEGHDIRVLSAYRSYATQERVFAARVQRRGEAAAARFVARPGYSEHQLGTTVDLTTVRIGYELRRGFGAEPPGLWLGEHAHRFGFALSFPEGTEEITGIGFEPWHYRYIGREHAERWEESGLVLLEYLLGMRE